MSAARPRPELLELVLLLAVTVVGLVFVSVQLKHEAFARGRASCPAIERAQ